MSDDLTDRQDILPPGYAQNEPWSGPEHRRRRRGERDEDHPGRRKHPVLLALLIVFALLLALAIGGVVWAEEQINPGGHHGPSVAVSIPKGASTSQIGSILSRAGVIHSGTLFALYVRIHGDGPLYPGSYSLPKNSSYKSAISALEAGPKLVTDRLVIPEGFTIRQIAAAVGALPQLHLSAQRFLAAATGGEVRSPYEPAGVNNLEGLLFPATYQVRQGESEIDVLEQMVGAFDDQATAMGLYGGRRPAARDAVPGGHGGVHRRTGSEAVRGSRPGRQHHLQPASPRYAPRGRLHPDVLPAPARPSVDPDRRPAQPTEPLQHPPDQGAAADADRQSGPGFVAGGHQSAAARRTCTSSRSSPAASSVLPQPRRASISCNSSAAPPVCVEQPPAIESRAPGPGWPG